VMLAKPGLPPVFVVVTVNFPASKIERAVGSRGRLCGVGARLMAGLSGIRIPIWERDFYFLQNV
jgi:hypothetical protein